MQTSFSETEGLEASEVGIRKKKKSISLLLTIWVTNLKIQEGKCFRVLGRINYSIPGYRIKIFQKDGDEVRWGFHLWILISKAWGNGEPPSGRITLREQLSMWWKHLWGAEGMNDSSLDLPTDDWLIDLEGCPW